MNRSSALALLDLTDTPRLDDIQTAFRARAKLAHPDLTGGTDAPLRQLILARDLLIQQMNTGPDPFEVVYDLSERLIITPQQAVQGGDIIQEIPVPLELICDSGPSRSLMHRRSLRITLPKGLRQGDRLRLKTAPPGGTAYIFRIDIEPAGDFQVAGDDLWMTAVIDAHLLRRGGAVMIDTPHGLQDVFLGRATQDGACLCLKGLGLPPTDQHGGGDLYIRIVAAPSSRPAADLLASFHQTWA